MALLRLLGAAAGCLLLLGCATWEPVEAKTRLPVPQPSADAVACELAFVQWNAAEPLETEQLWRDIDEQFLPPETRRYLTDNGLRIGLLSGTLPAALIEKLSSTADPIAALTAEELSPGTEMLSRREKRQCRLGISEVLEVLPQSPRTHVVLFNDAGQVRAELFEQPRGFFTLTPYAQGNNQLRVELVPGIDHGAAKQRVIGNQGAFRFDVRRDQRLFDSLGFFASIEPGQTLLITCTPEPKGIGSTLFANRFSSSSDQLMLLVRVARAQSSVLLGPSDQLEPLVTPLE